MKEDEKAKIIQSISRQIDEIKQLLVPPRPQRNDRPNHLRCFRCDKTGHFIRDCPELDESTTSRNQGATERKCDLREPSPTREREEATNATGN